MKKNYQLKSRQKSGVVERLCSKSLMGLAVLVLLFFASGCEIFDEIEDNVVDHVKTPSLKLMAEGLTSPVFLTEAPDGSGRLFVLEQPGMIRIIQDGKLVEEPFLDITDKVVELNEHYDERGLLSLAFHPGYASNGRFFIFYSSPLWPNAPNNWDHTNVVAEYTVSADPMKADKGSERILLHENHPYMNHNGGTLAFGPMDGYLYISIGDGGNRDDQGMGHAEDWYDRNPGGNGQDIYQNLKGDILRIDVNGAHPYAIPPDNPFVMTDGMDETYAYGFRNPYRFSFDMGGDYALYSQDAGQELREEINRVVKGGNYGWNVKEGTLCFNAEDPTNPFANCPDQDPQGNPLIPPVIEFKNSKHGAGVGLVVVGGYVYRGSELPHLRGQYIFGTWSKTHDVPNGLVFKSQPQMGHLWGFSDVEFKNTPTGDLNSYLLGFGQDREGEVYVLTTDTEGPHGHTGKVYKMVSKLL
jgi:glucose/arabinose dehydrogenase